MVKCKTLRDILFHDRHCKIGTIIDVEDEKIGKLEDIGAVARLEVKPKVEINVIKNPVKVDNEDIELPHKTAEKIYRENKVIKRKYNRRQESFSKRR